MGFDEDYKKVSTPGQLYKQIGNSVGTTVVSELARQILNQGMLNESQREIKDSSKVVNKQTQLALWDKQWAEKFERLLKIKKGLFTVLITLGIHKILFLNRI